MEVERQQTDDAVTEKGFDLEQFQQEYALLKKECDNLRGVLLNKPSAWKEREKKYQYDEKRWEDDRVKFKKQIKALQSEIAQLREQQKVQQLEKINQDLHSKVLELNTEVDNQKQKNHQLDLQITSLTLERQQLQDQIKDLQKKVEKNQSKIQDIQESIREQEQPQRQYQPTNTFNRLDSISTQGGEGSRTLPEEKLSSSQSIQNQSVQNDKIEELRQELQQFQKEKQLIQMQISKLEKDNAQYQQEKQVLQEQNLTLNQQKQELQVIIDNFYTDKNQNVEDFQVQREKLKIDNEELQVQNQNLHETINQLRQQLSALSGQVEYQTPTRSLSHLNSQLVSPQEALLEAQEIPLTPSNTGQQPSEAPKTDKSSETQEMAQENNKLRAQNLTLMDQIKQLQQSNQVDSSARSSTSSLFRGSFNRTSDPEIQEITPVKQVTPAKPKKSLDRASQKLHAENESLKNENDDLSSQIQDLETIIESLRSQIRLQDEAMGSGVNGSYQGQNNNKLQNGSNQQDGFQQFRNWDAKAMIKDGSLDDNFNQTAIKDMLFQLRKSLSPQDFIELINSNQQVNEEKVQEVIKKLQEELISSTQNNGSNGNSKIHTLNGLAYFLANGPMTINTSTQQNRNHFDSKTSTENDQGSKPNTPFSLHSNEHDQKKIKNLEAKVDQYKLGQEQLLQAMQTMDKEKKSLEDQLAIYLKRIDQSVEDYVKQESNEQNKSNWFKVNPQLVVLKSKVQGLEEQLRIAHEEREMLKLKLYSMAMPSPRKNKEAQPIVQQIDDIKDSFKYDQEAPNTMDIKIALQQAQNIDESLIAQITERTQELEQELQKVQNVNRQLEQQNSFYRTQLVNSKVQIGDIQMESFQLKRAMIDYKQEHQNMQKEMDVLKHVVSTRFPIQGQNAELVQKQWSKLYQNMDRMSNISDSTEKLELKVQETGNIKVEMQEAKENGQNGQGQGQGLDQGSRNQ